MFNDNQLAALGNGVHTLISDIIRHCGYDLRKSIDIFESIIDEHDVTELVGRYDDLGLKQSIATLYGLNIGRWVVINPGTGLIEIDDYSIEDGHLPFNVGPLVTEDQDKAAFIDALKIYGPRALFLSNEALIANVAPVQAAAEALAQNEEVAHEQAPQEEQLPEQQQEAPQGPPPAAQPEPARAAAPPPPQDEEPQPAAPRPQEEQGWGGYIAEEVGGGVWDSLYGFWCIARHPIQTLQNVGHAVTHPLETAQGMLRNAMEHPIRFITAQLTSMVVTAGASRLMPAGGAAAPTGTPPPPPPPPPPGPSAFLNSAQGAAQRAVADATTGVVGRTSHITAEAAQVAKAAALAAEAQAAEATIMAARASQLASTASEVTRISSAAPLASRMGANASRGSVSAKAKPVAPILNAFQENAANGMAAHALAKSAAYGVLDAQLKAQLVRAGTSVNAEFALTRSLSKIKI